MTRTSGISRIRSYYGIPAQRGMTVTFRGERVVITSATRTGMHLRVRYPDGRRALIHPTWEVVYPDPLDQP